MWIEGKFENIGRCFVKEYGGRIGKNNIVCVWCK